MGKRIKRAGGLRAFIPAIAEALERRVLLTTVTAIQGQNFNVGDLDGPVNAASGAISGDVYVPANASISARRCAKTVSKSTAHWPLLPQPPARSTPRMSVWSIL